MSGTWSCEGPWQNSEMYLSLRRWSTIFFWTKWNQRHTKEASVFPWTVSYPLHPLSVWQSPPDCVPHDLAFPVTWGLISKTKLLLQILQTLRICRPPSGSGQWTSLGALFFPEKQSWALKSSILAFCCLSGEPLPDSGAACVIVLRRWGWGEAISWEQICWGFSQRLPVCPAWISRHLKTQQTGPNLEVLSPPELWEINLSCL